MKRTPALLAVLAPSFALLLGASLPACSAPARATVAAEPFEDDTWMLLRGEQTDLVEVALPGPDADPVFATGDYVAFARDLIVSHPALFGVRDAATLVLNGTEVAADGTTDVSFRQVVSGGRVLETDLLVRIAQDGSLRAVLASLRAIDGPLPLATITPAQAIAAAAQVTTPDGDAFTPVGDAELVVEQIDGTTTYGLRYSVDGNTAKGPAQVRVNARTGVASFEGFTDADVLKVGTAASTLPGEAMRSFPVDEADGIFELRSERNAPLEGITSARTPAFIMQRCNLLFPPEGTTNPSAFWKWTGNIYGTALHGMVLKSDGPPEVAAMAEGAAKGIADAYPNLIEAEAWFHEKYATNSIHDAALINICFFDRATTCSNAVWSANAHVFGIFPPCAQKQASFTWQNRQAVARPGDRLDYGWAVQHDSLVHEFAHALTIERLPPYKASVEHETKQVMPQAWPVAEHVADAFAVLYNHTKNADAPPAVAANFAGSGRPLRDFSNPHEGVAGQPRWLGEAYQGTPTAGNKVLWEDNGGAHSNSGIGNHAFALAVQGGTQQDTALSVPEPASWDEMTQTYGAAFLAPKKLADRLPKTLLGTAGKLIDAATTPRAKKALLCAWGAVGLVRAKDQETFHTGCVRAAEIADSGAPKAACEGRADGFYCTNDVSYGAVRCVDGKTAGGLQCPTGTACSVGGDGQKQLVCPNLCKGQPDGDACLPDPADLHRTIGVHCAGGQVGHETVKCGGTSDAGAPPGPAADAGPTADSRGEDAHCAYAPGRAPKGLVASALALVALAFTCRRR